ncbi:MAG: alpha/beta hydrolase [Candidatus Dormibacteria bacterium]
MRELLVKVDARNLEVFDAGDAGDPAVIVHHGTPGSGILYDPWVEDARQRGLRLIGYSRPGYGASSRRPGRDVAQCAEDVTAITDALGIARFATWGVSGGGPHALATAALFPERCVAAVTLASVAPYDSPGLDFLAGMGEDNVIEFNAALQGEAAIRPLAEAQLPAMRSADPVQMAAQMRTVLSTVDADSLTDRFGEFMARYGQHGLSASGDGWIDDDLVFTRPWGFDLDWISIPLQIVQGDHDLMVPPAHGAWLASRMPQAEFRALPNDGHVALLATRIPEVHAWLASRF